MRSFVLAAACAVASAFLFSASDSRACSVCQAGDPIYSAGGAGAQEKGSLSVYLELQGWYKTSGLLPHEPDEPPEPGSEQNRGEQIGLYLGWTPIDRLTATLLLPYRFNKITERHEFEEPENMHLDGFGDLSLHLGYVLWRNRDVLPSTWVEARGFFKAPSGESNETVDGAQDPHLQPGTGSWDFGFGLAGAHRLDWASLYLSAFYRENLEGSLDYKYGDVVLTNAAVEVPLSHFCENAIAAAFTPGFELNFRYSEKDTSHGVPYDDSGGFVLYATPVLRLRLPWFEGRRAPFLRAAVMLPVTDAWLNGKQDEGPVWSAGIGMAY